MPRESVETSFGKNCCTTIQINIKSRRHIHLDHQGLYWNIEDNSSICFNRPHEKDGIDYHFVSRKKMEEWVLDGSFIESGEYNGNLYGTLDAELLRILSTKKTPVINIHPSALNAIRNSRFSPLIIFIAPPDLQTLKATRLKKSKLSKHSQSRQFTESDLEQMITTSLQIEDSCSQFWDAKVINSDIDTAFGNLCSTLHKFESEHCWIPLDWITSYRSCG